MSNDSPFVSIIIPCRNGEKFIGKCLDSIIATDYPKNKRKKEEKGFTNTVELLNYLFNKKYARN